MMQVQSLEEGSRDLKDFIQLPYELYRGDRYWVPPLRMAVREMLDPQKHPFYQHGKSALFLAKDGDQVLGRLGVSYDQDYVSFHQEKTAFFGFFEAYEDPQVVKALFEQGKKWARDQGAVT